MAEKRSGTRKSTARRGRAEKELKGGRVVECPVSVCPIGMLLTATGEVRPDVVEHLLKAGREFILAAQALIEARSDILKRESSLHKIEVE